MDTTIESKRILLRKFVIEDYESVFKIGSNTKVQKHTGEKILKSPIEAKDIIKDRYLSDYKNYGYGRLAAIFKPENKIIGFAGLKYLPQFKESDIGFRFLPEYWGKGIATEISIEIIKYGFEFLKLKRIIGIADPENIGSCRVLEKVGLKFYKFDTYDNDDDKKYNWYQILIDDYIL
jgi:RimJ/RimL family protein N-acetyltransferase